MSITVIHGDILATGADYVVIPVNTVGALGAGLAKQARNRWPAMELDYGFWCDTAQGGDVGIWREPELLGPRPVWFATKEDWRHPSKLIWIEVGLRKLHALIPPRSTIALPLVGCGLGGLNTERVIRAINQVFGDDKEHNLELWVAE